MILRFFITFCILITFILTGVDNLYPDNRGLVNTSNSQYAVLKSVDLSDVIWTQGFWGERFDVCHQEMIPNMWHVLKDANISHSWANFLIAAGMEEGEHEGPPWHDGDFYKWFEAVATVYAVTKDEELNQLMDEIIPVIAKSQREDGYIHSPVVIKQRHDKSAAKEFQDRLHFETYNMGHLMTAACVHYRATGKTSLLDLAKNATDYLYNFYKKSSPELARNAICPSHYMGVVEMYRTTKDSRYIELAKNLVEIRDLVENGTDHNQDRLPFREQTKAQGHAVRANYLYAGVADVCIETGDETLLETLDLICNDLVSTKMYITGGCGALYDGVSPDGTSYQPSEIQQVHQAYGRDYQLPNITAHNESCANVGNVLWNWRMLAITGDARFTDVLELALYNSVLSSISLDGKKFFYTNPLAVVDNLPYTLRWSREREAYISCFCCPPNVVRTIAQVGNYAYNLSDKGVWINLYGANVLESKLVDGSDIKMTQVTEYPWDGDISITMNQVSQNAFSVFLRIPGWTKGAVVKVNGRPLTSGIRSGQYLEIHRTWFSGDVIELSLPMSAKLIESNPLVEENCNQVAVKRGPVVYCLESIDLPESVNLSDMILPVEIDLTSRFVEIGNSKVTCLEGTCQILKGKAWQNQLYREVTTQKPVLKTIRLIPYYAWGNRGKSEMMVWLPVSR